ncbi:Aspartyl/glutamyl-tRNA(Asn/Gln) amidotransferase subunit B [Mesomycoplasma conjunctivae]|uniref:Aspartyl/glutamyl-tRNA(Asn/Gln) amidotransferase subunit B n=1 Tax=Mesomycoplasma conjunctivae (strain ATCC 25834 / NCTC 10147 / HRC/581) TaxID=572263 RepID=C5J5W7_MESCH|nr:Asp-tRNA(Asn)/Glu-tRNA(Gln) amidotransferase subunit GatB [Mesomycoplasma conjunctivae]CAT04858.1 Glutamyl-tRNA amidotransferase subunit B [Mesomycoplasma conjunctivae]VEU65930.1 Aspartyl/glutamyl-tRNA(Asn/Gln) amidotransferase subunit B [Mesomycoplasma conjunctivae]
MNKYEVIIGVEIHLELNTKSKIFSNACNKIGEPNTNFNLYDLGYLGTLPQINKQAVEKSIMLAKALKMKIAPFLAFDRKNYFYPDLPKGFQITQQFHPIGKEGKISVESEGFTREVEIERIHLEEDTAKQIHQGEFTYLDYNRCGAPLIEIVTKPVIKSAQEAANYVDNIRKYALFLGISDAKLENGSLRADVNISVRKVGQLDFNNKVEIKNINSISNIKKATELEIEEQIQAYEEGQIVKQVTKKFDDKLVKNTILREKTSAIDYKYFPEPNLPIIELPLDFVNSIQIKPTPDLIQKFLVDNKVSDFYILQILNSIEIWTFLNNSRLVNWDLGVKIFFAEVLPIVNKLGWQNLNIQTSFFNLLVKDLYLKKITVIDAKKAINLKQKEENLDYHTVIKKVVVPQLNVEELSKIIDNIFIQENEQIQKNINNKERIFKYLIGKLMKEVKGAADPKLINELLQEKINSNL